jgi:hypothetical protein
MDEAIGFRVVAIGDMALRAGRDQRADHGGSERARSPGDDNVAICEVHINSRHARSRTGIESNPTKFIRQKMDGRVKPATIGG